MSKLDVKLEKATVLYEERKFQEAIDACKAVRRKDKWNFQAVMIIVISKSNLGLIGDAISFLQQAVKANLNDAKFSDFLNNLCYETKNRASAESLFQELISKSPESVGPWAALMASKLTYKEYGEALKLAEGFSDSRNGGRDTLLKRLVKFHSENEHHKQQISALVALIQRQPGAITLIVKCADLAERIGDTRTWNNMSKLAIPCLLKYIEEKDVTQSILTENAIYSSFVKKRENEQNYYDYFSMWSKQMVEFGRTFQADLPLPTNDKKVLNLAFIHPSGLFLGNSEVMFSLVANSHMYDDIEVKTTIYCPGTVDERLREEADKLNVDLIDASMLWGEESTRSWLNLLTAIREDIVSKGITMAVWVSVPATVMFAFAFKVAPIQIYLSLKFGPFSFEEIDGYIMYGSMFGGDKRIHGREWKTFPISTSIEPTPVDSDVLSDLRNQMGDFDTILGCLAREEKFNDTEYIDTVIRILSDNQNCVYLWTGKNINLKVQEAFEKAGVAERTKYIGWVDTNVYAQLIDVFLETFLFGCGITAFQSMAVGTPLVVLHGPITSLGFNFHDTIETPSSNPQAHEKIHQLVNPANAEPGLTYAMTVEEYYELACRLIRDKAYRVSVGEAYKKFYGELLNRPDLSAKAFFQRCHEVYTDKITQN